MLIYKINQDILKLERIPGMYGTVTESSCPHTWDQPMAQRHDFAIKTSFVASCCSEHQLTNSVFFNNWYSVWRSHFKWAWLLYLIGLITMVITQDHILVNNCFVIAFTLHNNDTVNQFLSLHNYRGCLITFRINMHSSSIVKSKL